MRTRLDAIRRPFDRVNCGGLSMRAGYAPFRSRPDRTPRTTLSRAPDDDQIARTPPKTGVPNRAREFWGAASYLPVDAEDDPATGLPAVLKWRAEHHHRTDLDPWATSGDKVWDLPRAGNGLPSSPPPAALRIPPPP
jgi:hypothetical protein